MDEIPKPLPPSNFYGECKGNFLTYHGTLATNVTQLLNINPKSINAQIGLTAQRIGINFSFSFFYFFFWYFYHY
jgi:hypothetical protein